MDGWKTVVVKLRSLYAPQSPQQQQFDAIVNALITSGRHASLGQLPSLGGKSLDLVAFLDQMQKRGGFSEVETKKMWPEICAELGMDLQTNDAATLSMNLKVQYMRYLYPYCRSNDQNGKQSQVGRDMTLDSSGSNLQTSGAENSASVTVLNQNAQMGPSPAKKTKHSAEYTSDVQGVNWNRAKTCWEVTYYDEFDNKRRKTFSVTPERPMEMAKTMAETMKRNALQINQRNQKDRSQLTKNLQFQHQQQQQTASPTVGGASQPTNLPPIVLQRPQHHPHQQVQQQQQMAQTQSPQKQHLSAAQQPKVPPEAVPELPVEGPVIITQENFVQSLLSEDFKTVVSAVNILLEITADSTRDFAFSDYPQDLLDAIVTLMEKTNPYSVLIKKNNAKIAGTPLGELVESTWTIHLETTLPPQTTKQKNTKEKDQMLLCLLGAVRNASFSVANENLLAYHTGLITQLVSILFAAPEKLVAAQAALEIISQISRHIDITGRRRPEYDVILEDSLEALAPSHIKADRASGDATASATVEYVSTVLQIFPQLQHLIYCEERAWVLCALETLSKLAQVETNTEIFSRIPEKLLRRLSELLYVPANGLDALIPEKNSRRALYEFYSKVMLTTDDNVDIEIRDNVLEILSTLAELSNSLRRRVCCLPDIIKTLLRIVSVYSRSREVPKLAAYTLQSLAQLPANAEFFIAHQEFLYTLASKDDLIADLICNTLCNVFHPPGG